MQYHIDARVHQVYCIKLWVKRRKIHEPYRGYLSSYSYTLMVLFYLQREGVLLCLQDLERREAVQARDPALQVLGGDLYLVGGGIESLGAETVLQTQGSASLDGVDIVGDTGVRVQGGSMTLIEGTIVDAGVEGVHGDAGDLTVDGTTITGAAGDAIRLDSGVTASIVDVELTGNGGWGIDCDGVVTLSACTATASGNTLGDFQQIAGCDVATNAVCGPPLP